MCWLIFKIYTWNLRENIVGFRLIKQFKKMTDKMIFCSDWQLVYKCDMMFCSQEAGRYPAYKEMVTELSWVNNSEFLFFSIYTFKVLISKYTDLWPLPAGSGTVYSSSQGSESHSSASSLSSGTPLGSVSGLSQATLPVSLPLGAKMADICGSTEAQFHPDSTESDSRSEQLRTVSRGPTELLQDSVIRSEGELGERRREGRKTPSPPIRRTRSHVTVSGGVCGTLRSYAATYDEWNFRPHPIIFVLCVFDMKQRLSFQIWSILSLSSSTKYGFDAL